MRYESKEWLEERDRKLMEWVRDPDAVRMLQILGQTSELWDDLIDQDRTIDQDTINSVFFSLLVELPGNRFWEAHKSALIPVIVASINSWSVANTLENGTDDDLNLAYVLRDSLLQLIPFTAGLVRGRDCMHKVGVEAWRFLTRHESATEYKRTAP